MKPRFILTGTTIYDRVHKRVVVTIDSQYANLICLETVDHGQPFTAMVEWMNGLCNSDLASEGVPTSDCPDCGNPLNDDGECEYVRCIRNPAC